MSDQPLASDQPHKASIMLRIRTILHPTDFSEASTQALQVARSLARDHGARLVLLTVPPPPPPVNEHYLPDAEYPGIVESSRREVNALAAAITDVPVETRVVSGSPGAAIVQVALDCQADLIVMGTHGRTGLGRLLMGSVAEHVLRHAPCPVLSIKPGAAAKWSTSEEAAAPAACST
jgi:nucleotide-binding universal stress UspA family protein